MNDDGSNPLQLTSVGLNDHATWAPGGKRVIYAALGGPEPGIYSMNPDGTAHTRITIPTVGATDLQPTPLGKKVAFGRLYSDGSRELFAVDLDGTDLHQLTSGGNAGEFSASPRGDKLAYASGTGLGGLNIYLLDIAGGGVTQLTNSPTVYKAGLAFSPSGKQIAFTRVDPGQGEAIFVMKADGTEVTRLTHGGFDILPRWSPDGRRIGFSSTRDGVLDVYTMLANGSDVRRLRDSPPNQGNWLWGWMSY